MSWYTDPQLFIYGYSTSFEVYRITKVFGSTPLVRSDVYIGLETLSFSKHLYLGYNKETDYDAFKASFPKSGSNFKLINSQGSVIDWDGTTQTGTWSREEKNTPFWSLPGIAEPEKSVTEKALEKKVSELEEEISSLRDEVNTNKVEKEAQDKRVSDLEAKNVILENEAHNYKVEKEAIDKIVLGLEAENYNLKAQVNHQRDEKLLAGLEALEKQVSDLTSKLADCCGAGSGGSSVEEPWTSGQPIPSNWVSFEDLDVQAFSKNIPLTITRASVGPKFRDDNTTNVQPNCFYRGIFPLVIVDVAELTPKRKEARFDPDIWSSYINNGIRYAARKPFASEMSVDAHKTC